MRVNLKRFHLLTFFWRRLKEFLVVNWQLFSFVLLVMIYMLEKSLSWFAGRKLCPKILIKKFTPPLSSFYLTIVKRLDRHKEETISRLELIDLSVRNMKMRKTRTMVTMGGMAIGIALIVFLVSIGYGLQKLVISRVARLDELKQTDVVPGLTENLLLDDKAVADFTAVANVVSGLPLISVVGRISYQNSVSDLAVYGVTSGYLEESAIRPVKGKIFESDHLSLKVDDLVGQVAGTSVESEVGQSGEELGRVEFALQSNVWYRVRENPGTNAEILGYTRRVEGLQAGLELYGGEYDSDEKAGRAAIDEDGQNLGKWILTKVLLWKKEVCVIGEQAACEDNKYLPVMEEDGSQTQIEAYLGEVAMRVAPEERTVEPQVLGVTSENGESGSLPLVEVATESAEIQKESQRVVSLSDAALKKAVVNRAMLAVLGLEENKALNEKFTVVFVVVGNLTADTDTKIESAPDEYTIVGITPDEKTPVVYVPFIDLRSLGVTNYSQVKLIADSQENLTKIRQTVEGLGYGTISVVDTVKQIDQLFKTARIFLGTLGLVALAVAALGMFNTLTVSLLERTREVGLMKAMGMKSSEVKELFLTESMIMGFSGGVLGLVLGIAFGKLLSFVLSSFAVLKGVGIIDISHVPFLFSFIIVLLSLLVGVITGLYPARRATKISALNALRYE